jgi:hypothetical protein
MALMANELAMLCHDVPALWDRLRAVRAAEDSRRRIKPGE